MDYEKKYKEALERAKLILSGEGVPALPGMNTIEAIFPELSEIKDEQIRKGLINGFEFYSEQEYWGTEKFPLKITDILAWLEKQCERKPVLVPKFRVGDTIRFKDSNAEYLITEISDGYYRGKGWCLDIVAGDKSNDYELVKQKPEWSEEEYISYILTNCMNYAEKMGYVEEKNNRYIHQNAKEWLKSLRPQEQWKPTEE